MKKTITLLLILLIRNALLAQDSNRVFITTGVGIIKSPGALRNVFDPSIAFNSGIEAVNKKNWYLHGTLDFNMLKYNQQVKEGGSPYLFHNTSSSLVMIAVNAGKNFPFGNNKWFASLYTGGGYLNVGEPRLVSLSEDIIKQEVRRMGGLFGKAGSRIGYKTRIKFLQTIYLDGSWFTSPLTVQGAKLHGVSVFIGTRMSMK
jgi:hypothetical protein